MRGIFRPPPYSWWSKKEPGNADDEAIDKFDGSYHIATMFDIYLLLEKAHIQPGGSVRVGLPIPASLQGKKLLIVRINDDGTVTEFKVTQMGNLMFFTTDHFSRYAILELNEDNPRTGSDKIPLIWWIAICAVALALLTGSVFLIRHVIRRRSARNGQFI